MLSEEGRRMIQINNSLRDLSPKAKEALARSSRFQRKKVLCKDTGRIFQSLMSCAAYKHMSVQGLKYRIAQGLENMEIIE